MFSSKIDFALEMDSNLKLGFIVLSENVIFTSKSSIRLTFLVKKNTHFYLNIPDKNHFTFKSLLITINFTKSKMNCAVKNN